ncbi:MAG TPA: ABC transporter substrate-binding protein [Dehalococcoidia bacterium]|nr:ABC transporter substrate-binding protein [Dehalococcoidia bacterium]
MEERRFWQQRLYRRQVLQGAALSSAGLAAVAAFGCGRGERTQITREAVQPKRGGVLRRASKTTAFNGGLDPHVQQGSQTGEMGLFYQTLVRLNPRDITVEPELAQRWEQPSPTEYLFRLAPAVKWHNKPPANGRALVASDVVFSLERLRTNDPRFLSRSLLDLVDKIEAVDPATVRITTKEPDVTTLSNLAALSAKVLAPEVVEKAGDKFGTADVAVGTGAFILQTLDDTGAVVVRNPDYWKPGLPYLDSVHLTVIREAQAEWAAFLAGQIDFAYVPGTESKKVAAEQADKFDLRWFKDVSNVVCLANLQRKPFDDPRVTRALKLLVDHQEAKTAYAEVWWGRGYISAVFGAALDGWDFTEEEYQARFLEFKQPKEEAVREALRLLAAAGFTRETPLRFVLNGQRGVGAETFSNAFSQLLHGQFLRLGQGVVQPVELRLFDQATNRQVMSRRDFEYAINSLVPGQPFDPDDWFRTIYHTKGSRNYGGYSDPKLDAMIDRQRTLFDVAQRKAAVKEIIVYLIENAPYTSFSGRYVLNAAKPWVQEWVPEGLSAVRGDYYERTWLNL